MTTRSLRPGTLWPAIVARTAHALACGALRPIETVQTTLDDGGIRFVVRQVSSLAAKPVQDSPVRQSVADPFLPHDPDLFVADVSPTHFALLNKFNVIDHHLLVVTRAFEPQEALLDLDDFTALFACLAQFDGLGFYNGGREAGASQAHKHLQIVPLSLGDAAQALPIDALIEAATFTEKVGRLPGLPFEHAFTRLTPGSPEQVAVQALERYRLLLEAVGLGSMDVGGREHQSAPYNLLATPKWMLLVPRSAEKADDIAVNSLGFAGSLFVRDAQRLDAVRRIGPMTILRRVTLPRSDIA
ncbi:ATP adenylyltransferase family protein [Trinickia dinghuensis]|uniref:Phosphorylase n=1 Tax=Trinickia dinghuensis TaxID=2291023 RepID=A0A3D8JZM3_9BURK|nr:phosphorylase [Trinickia dinghuensis]RDU98613.1 phosphorylase [Trinickia dinghuensis]